MPHLKRRPAISAPARLSHPRVLPSLGSVVCDCIRGGFLGVCKRLELGALGVHGERGHRDDVGGDQVPLFVDLLPLVVEPKRAGSLGDGRGGGGGALDLARELERPLHGGGRGLGAGRGRRAGRGFRGPEFLRELHGLRGGGFRLGELLRDGRRGLLGRGLIRRGCILRCFGGRSRVRVRVVRGVPSTALGSTGALLGSRVGLLGLAFLGAAPGHRPGTREPFCRGCDLG